LFAASAARALATLRDTIESVMDLAEEAEQSDG
jgi:hypothetical protein